MVTRGARLAFALAPVLAAIAVGCATGPGIHGVVGRAGGGELASGDGSLAFPPYSFADDDVFVEMNAVNLDGLRAGLGSALIGGIDFDIVANQTLLTPAVAEFRLSRPQSCGAHLNVYHQGADGRFTLMGNAIVGNDAARASYRNITEEGLWVVLVGGG